MYTYKYFRMNKVLLVFELLNWVYTLAFIYSMLVINFRSHYIDAFYNALAHGLTANTENVAGIVIVPSEFHPINWN